MKICATAGSICSITEYAICNILTDFKKYIIYADSEKIECSISYDKACCARFGMKLYYNDELVHKMGRYYDMELEESIKNDDDIRLETTIFECDDVIRDSSNITTNINDSSILVDYNYDHCAENSEDEYESPHIEIITDKSSIRIEFFNSNCDTVPRWFEIIYPGVHIRKYVFA